MGQGSGFSLDHLDMGDLSPPPYSTGGQSVNGRLMRGEIDLIGGDLTLIDYIIN